MRVRLPLLPTLPLAPPLIAVIILLAVCLSSAQEPEPAPRARQNTAAAPNGEPPALSAGMPLDELDTYLLRDASGKLVPVVGMKFEDFKQLLDQRLKLAPPEPPGYTLDVLAITGAAEKERADLQVQATVRTRDSGWVRVPLRLQKTVLREPAKYEGGGEQFTTYEPEGDGYVCWIKGGSSKPHVITLSIAAPITDSGTQRQLAIALPRATESSLRLEVPLSRVEATLKNGSEGIVSTQSAVRGKSEIAVLGPGGELQVAWLPAREAPVHGAAQIESSGEIAVKVESKNRISSDARLRVRNLGGSVSSFQVRLPAGMELTPATAVGYTVSPIIPAAPNAPNSGASAASGAKGSPTAEAAAAAEIVEVKLDRPSSGVVEVRLQAALAPEARVGAKAIEPGSFEVLGAVRQRGTIDFTVDGDWSLQWTESANVRRVDVPADNPATAKALARFEYFRQPCELKLQVAARPTRISVEPTYLVQVDARQVRLEATLKYRLRGARMSSVSIAPGDWKFDRVTSDGIVDLDAVAPADGKPLVLPVREGTAELSEWEVKLEAHREIPEGSSSLLFSLPRPVADVVTPATVVVAAADNVELTPHTSELRGLTPDPAPLAIRLPARQQQPLVYRDLGAGEPAVFSSGFQIRPRRTSVQADTRIAMDHLRINVEQRLQYRISYEAQRAFEIMIPGELPKKIDLRVMLGTQSLPLAPVATEAATFNPLGRRMRFEAPGDQIGLCEFVVKYSLPMPRINRSAPAAVSVPLVVPAEEANQELGGQTIVASFSEDLRVESAGENDDPEAGFSGPEATAEPNGLQQLRLALPTMTSKSEWKVTLIEPGGSGATNVVKAWVQTWLSPHKREDRAAWRLTTSQDSIRIRLPIGANLEEAQVAFNGRPVDKSVEGAALRVNLPEAEASGDVVLEVWYSVVLDAQRWGLATNQFEPPMIAGTGGPRRTYWQVCLPESEHLLQEPGDFAAELIWDWRGYYWGRRGALDQAQLERWVGASSQDPVPAATNQYLFSSFGSSTPLRFVTASRRYLLLFASCAALGLGLLLIHVRQARQPSLLLAGAILLAGGVFLSPETALLLGEAAALGLALVIAAGVWAWVVSGRTPWRPHAPSVVIPGIAEPKSMESPHRVERAMPATTSTAPLAVSASEPR